MRYLIVAGGTGGHLYPALALVSALRKKDETSEFAFIGTKNRIESKEVPALGYKFYPIDVVGSNGGLVHKAISALKIAKAIFTCKKILKEFKPDLVVGFGNYISMPVIIAAHRLNIKIMLHEQNSNPGKANLFLAKYADAIVGSYPENKDFFPSKKTRILGNPRASEAAQIQKNKEVLKDLNLDPKIPTVVVVMGSLGSESVNEMMGSALKKMQGRPYQVLYVTGPSGYDSFPVKSEENIQVVPYIDGLKVMVNADLVVIRGGATTLAEITALGLASIIIPSPYVPNQTNVKNAMALQNAKAALVLEEKGCTSDMIVDKIDEVMLNESLRTSLGEHALKCANPHASRDIIAWMDELCGRK